MTDAKSQLIRLREIQDLVFVIQEARAVIDGAPGRLETIEGEFRDRNAEYVAIKDRHDELEADRALRTNELAELEIDRKKFMDSLMQVKNQREYAAVLKEIDTVKARIAEHEDVVLKSMEELETLKSDMADRAEHIEAERKIVAEEHAKVEADVAAAEGKIRECEGRRASIEGGLPSDLVANVRRVEEGRRGLFLVPAEREMCTACHVRVRPQVFQEIKAASRLHTCSNCRRYLFVEASLRTDPSATAPEAPGVEAVNGGAV